MGCCGDLIKNNLNNQGCLLVMNFKENFILYNGGTELLMIIIIKDKFHVWVSVKLKDKNNKEVI